MKAKVSPVVVGIAVIALLAVCAFMYINANNSEPHQLPSSGQPYKPGYDGGGGHNTRPAPGASRSEMEKAAQGAKNP